MLAIRNGTEAMAKAMVNLPSLERRCPCPIKQNILSCFRKGVTMAPE